MALPVLAASWNGSAFEGATWPFGTNTYANPGLTNPGALPSGAPSCSSYTNTTDCMNIGYNVAANVAPTTAEAIGKGYQPPTGCRPDPYFPTWLKGIVYLQVSGSLIHGDRWPDHSALVGCKSFRTSPALSPDRARQSINSTRRALIERHSNRQRRGIKKAAYAATALLMGPPRDSPRADRTRC